MKSAFLFLATLIITTAHSQTKQEQKVYSAVEQLKNAMISGDKNELEKIVADKLSYGHSSGAVDDKNTFIEKLTSGKSDFVSVELTDQTISISDKTAIVRHSLFAKTNDNKVPGEVKLKVLLIFQKQGGKWLLLARQAVRS